MHENCSKLCSSILSIVWHYLVLQNVIFLLEGTFSLEKWKSKWPTIRNMCFQKLWKILFFKTKHILVMFYRHYKTFWYKFCNFKHFLKAENSEDSLASSCVEFSIGLSCNPVWDWVTVGTICEPNVVQLQAHRLGMLLYEIMVIF